MTWNPESGSPLGNPFADPFFQPIYSGGAPQPQFPDTGIPADFVPATPGWTLPTIVPGTSSPPTPGPGTPEPEPQQPPPIGFDPTPAPGIDAGSWFGAGLGGMFSPFFRSRAVRRASPAELLVRTGVNAIFKQVREFVRPAAPILSKSKALVPYVPRVVVPLVVGRLIGVFDLLIPTTLGSGELPPGALPRTVADIDYRGAYQRASGGLANYPVEMIGVPNAQFPLGRPGNVSTESVLMPMPSMPTTLPQPQARVDESFRGFLRRVAENKVQDFGRDWLADQLGVPRSTLPYPAREQGPPEPQRAPAPAPPATGTQAVQQAKQVSVPSSRSTTGRSSRSRSRVFTFGGIGTAILLIEASRRGRGSQTNPVISQTNPVTPTPIAPPIDTPSSPSPLTPLQPSPIGFATYYGGGFTGTNYCEPKPRGPRRKCLERAPVKFSGGRRKGKAAGTKCLRWEARKS